MGLMLRSYWRATRVCGAIVAGAGVAALAGWMTESPVLLGLRASYIPMAPNTAMTEKYRPRRLKPHQNTQDQNRQPSPRQNENHEHQIEGSLEHPRKG